MTMSAIVRRGTQLVDDLLHLKLFREIVPSSIIAHQPPPFVSLPRQNQRQTSSPALSRAHFTHLPGVLVSARLETANV